MAARISVMLFLLEEAQRQDDLVKRRRGGRIRNISLLSTNRDYIHAFRLTKSLIAMLQCDLVPLMPEQIRRGGLGNHTKILCTLSFLANGSYQNIIGKSIFSYVSQPSASRAIRAVVNALNHPDIIKKYIRFPQNVTEREALKQSFFDKFKIPGVIGCIDGTFVTIIRPKVNEERYYCRKGYHGRNVQIISDCDFNILHLDATFGGAAPDSLVFNNTVIKKHLEHLHTMGDTACLLGDSAYEQTSYMMTPCTDPEPGSPEEYYNSLHGTAWHSVDRTIAILKSRFRCLLAHKVLHYDPVMVCKIVIACCVLHNICNSAGLPVPELPDDLQEKERQVHRLLQQVHHHVESVTNVGVLEQGWDFRQQLVNTLWQAKG